MRPSHRQSAKQIARQIAKQQAAKLTAKQKADLRKGEQKPEDVEARRTRLKNLIKLGKERGFLTYAEINDHLPDDMVDAEQIETIITHVQRHGHPGLRRRRPMPKRC